MGRDCNAIMSRCGFSLTDQLVIEHEHRSDPCSRVVTTRATRC